MPEPAAEDRPSDETDSARPTTDSAAASNAPAAPPDPNVPAAPPDPNVRAATPDPDHPIYKGEPLDAERGPGLGCFWFQVVILAVLLVATPLSVWLALPSWLSAALLILSLVILFFVGQTTIFLLRLVAADRRAQRRPLRLGARRTVGQIEADADTTTHDVDQTDAGHSSDQDDARPG